ncbi:hypothetical protein NQ318_020608 [Aromia moschata]|uniref:Nuclear receptor coactivator 5 n=1 Tax=Aromia moschata TaxID=1265417 RepID=A0AAV8Z2B4_9CUCU|nr:hypothetical protein NQ318_020608 [Aromia moschata]
MDDDRPNIRPPGPVQHNDERGRKSIRKPRGGRADGRGRSNDRDHFIDRFDPPGKMDIYRDGPYYGRDDRDFIPPGPRPGYAPPMLDAPPPPEKNDCEIIVVAKALTEYAEFIEQKLKTLGLIVDLLFPNEDVPIGKVLANISSRGCLYAILIMPQNEEHRSLTLNILHGIPQEHRNMPIDDAMILISRNFEGTGESCSTNTRWRRGIEADSQESDPKQVELQSRILNILNKSTEPPIPTSITAPEPAAPPSQTPILKDPTVQKALDSLLLGDMFKSISGN